MAVQLYLSKSVNVVWNKILRNVFNVAFVIEIIRICLLWTFEYQIKIITQPFTHVEPNTGTPSAFHACTSIGTFHTRASIPTSTQFYLFLHARICPHTLCIVLVIFYEQMLETDIWNRQMSKGDNKTKLWLQKNVTIHKYTNPETTFIWTIISYIIYRWLSARLQWLQCVSNGVTAVLH